MVKINEDDKKKTIIDTALKLFDATCFGRTGVDLIIAESDVAKMTFYKYLGSKENLIKECLQVRDRQIRSQIKAQMKGKKKNGLNAVLNWHEQWFESDDFSGSLFVKAVNEFPEDEEIKDMARNHQEWIKDTISQSLDSDNKILLAESITSLLCGATVHRKVYKSSSGLDSVRNFIKQVS